jgi:ABC-type Na+ efflux pump permease subunit
MSSEPNQPDSPSIEEQLEELDRAWERQRQSLLATSRRGYLYVPTVGTAVMMIVIGLLVGVASVAFIVLVGLDMGRKIPGLLLCFPLFPVLFVALTLITGLSLLSKARRYQRAAAAYEVRRAALEAQLERQGE